MAKRNAPAGKPKAEKKVTRYTYDDIREQRTPETGHTSLLPVNAQVVRLPMDNGWSKAIQVGKLPEDDERQVVVGMYWAADPVLFWAASAIGVRCRYCHCRGTRSSPNRSLYRSLRWRSGRMYRPSGVAFGPRAVNDVRRDDPALLEPVA